MDRIKTKTEDLLAKLKENREKHTREFEELFVKYKGAAKEALLKRVEEVDSWDEPENLCFELEVPENHTRDYDLAISMLEWSTEELTELDARTFRRYVLDEWEWRESFENTKLSYR